MLIEQIEFELKRSRPPGRTCTATTGYLYDITKIFLSGLLFTAKLLHAAMYTTFAYLGQITYKT